MTDTIDSLKSLGAKERKIKIIGLLIQCIQDVLQMEPGQWDEDWFGYDDGFIDAGLDSVSATELKQKIQEIILNDQVSLESTIIFDYPTINKLSDYLSEAIANH